MRHRRHFVRAKADEYVAAQEDRLAGATGASSRHVSIKRLSELTGFDRGTIRTWLDAGCPAVSKGARGDDYVLDIREVWKWCERRAVTKALEGAPGAPGDPDSGFSFMGIKDPEKAARAMIRVLDAGERQKSLVRVSVVQAAMDRAMNLVKQSVMAIPERLAREVGGFPKDTVSKLRNQARGYCVSALEDGAKAVKKAFEGSDEA